MRALRRSWQAVVFGAWWASSRLVPRESLVRICAGCGHPMERLEPLSSLAPPGVTYWRCHTRRRREGCWALSPLVEPWRAALDAAHVPRYPMRTLEASVPGQVLRTALAGIHASVWPPNRPPHQDTNTRSLVQWVTRPGSDSVTPSSQDAVTSTGIGSSARLTDPPSTGGESSSRGRSVITRPMLAVSPDGVLLAAGAAGALVVAGAAAGAAAWWWSRMTRTWSPS